MSCDDASAIHFPGGVGLLPLADFATRSGLDILQAMLRGDYPAPPIAKTLSFILHEVEQDRVVFKGAPRPEHLNPFGGIHGGWIATLMDSALACSIMTTLKPGEAYTTAEFKVNLVRPLSADMGTVFCEGRLIHRGRTLATAEAFLKDANGKLLAHGTETCAIFPLESFVRGK
ncbi:PaaI family thioesterase [Phyllobacterium lublinensis]|uniref:PaaI family thioesterase n=1 Tax=Phyllobacterium lublinensis TaxID=2875708 RepID=UPI001CCE71CD|nr:PaaI family thioesterase [Phyllobacterium sp. 2063]MBZ9655083.1 PaaI family thioesterase [Phyllobacterium sp. 2063]